MRSGFVIGMRGIYWNDSEPAIRASGETLASGLLSPPSISGYKCDECGLVMMFTSATSGRTSSGGTKLERIICPKCGRKYSLAPWEIFENRPFHCRVCGLDFQIPDVKKQ
jgi:rubredoxin